MGGGQGAWEKPSFLGHQAWVWIPALPPKAVQTWAGGFLSLKLGVSPEKTEEQQCQPDRVVMGLNGGPGTFRGGRRARLPFPSDKKEARKSEESRVLADLARQMPAWPFCLESAGPTGQGTCSLRRPPHMTACLPPWALAWPDTGEWVTPWGADPGPGAQGSLARWPVRGNAETSLPSSLLPLFPLPAYLLPLLGKILSTARWCQNLPFPVLLLNLRPLELQS